MRTDPFLSALAFRRGQLDALCQTHLASGGLYSDALHRALALRLLSRAWAQYREDRAITLGTRLVGGECAAERDAFLTLLGQALPPAETRLAEAIRCVRRIAVAPLAEEARQAAEQVAASAPELEAVAATLASDRLPRDPLERLLAVVAHHRYSRGAESDRLAATAHSPCWAINLLAVARPAAFGLGASAPPCPGLVRRQAFRADCDAETRRDRVRTWLLDAVHDVAAEIDRTWRAEQRFRAACPGLRSSSRLGQAWLLLFGCSELTPAQLARALPATKAGAGKLLRQLADAHLARSNSPLAPFSSLPVAGAALAAFPD